MYFNKERTCFLIKYSMLLDCQQCAFHRSRFREAELNVRSHASAQLLYPCMACRGAPLAYWIVLDPGSMASAPLACRADKLKKYSNQLPTKETDTAVVAMKERVFREKEACYLSTITSCTK